MSARLTPRFTFVIEIAHHDIHPADLQGSDLIRPKGFLCLDVDDAHIVDRNRRSGALGLCVRDEPQSTHLFEVVASKSGCDETRSLSHAPSVRAQSQHMLGKRRTR